jgi:hypothetical protein
MWAGVYVDSPHSEITEGGGGVQGKDRDICISRDTTCLLADAPAWCTSLAPTHQPGRQQHFAVTLSPSAGTAVHHAQIEAATRMACACTQTTTQGNHFNINHFQHSTLFGRHSRDLEQQQFNKLHNMQSDLEQQQFMQRRMQPCKLAYSQLQCHRQMRGP